MSPATIQNAALYYDHWIGHWHRDTFGPDAWAIDLDLVGACKSCGMPLYLIEATRNPEKSTRIMRRLAALSGVPAILVRHDETGVVRATWQREKPVAIGGEEELKDALAVLRERHHEEGCR